MKGLFLRRHGGSREWDLFYALVESKNVSIVVKSIRRHARCYQGLLSNIQCIYKTPAEQNKILL